MNSFVLSFFISLSFSYSLSSATLHVGAGQNYATLEAAAAVAQPGDTILLHGGNHTGGQFIAGLQGTPDDWIFIKNAWGEIPVITGGTNAIQLSDPAYLHISGLTFQQQTGNGVNVDDGGTYDTPAYHLIFENCTFRDISATGNNDLLKLSGLDHFEITNCTFLNGAAGGSGIDMVGCHQGLIKGNYFENMGSNSIQAKGGTQHVRIEGNYFTNGGQRTLNLGGSTGLAFFRPADAPFEAADLQVYSNIIVGSWAAVAFVGAVNVEVVNNTIYAPQNWVIRILQENVDPDRFLECGDNTFRNNIILITANLPTETNIGPNTRPETFVFSNNLWFNATDVNWSGPDLPVPDVDGLVNLDPLLADPDAGDFAIPVNSPAAGSGYPVAAPQNDFTGMGFGAPRSIGALAANPVSAVGEVPLPLLSFSSFPNPAGDLMRVVFTLEREAAISIQLVGFSGRKMILLPETHYTAGKHEQVLQLNVPPGYYLLLLSANNKQVASRFIKH